MNTSLMFRVYTSQTERGYRIERPNVARSGAFATRISFHTTPRAGERGKSKIDMIN